jgi:hypothetical protein
VLVVPGKRSNRMRKTTSQGTSLIALFAKYYFGNQTKNDGMGREGSTYGNMRNEYILVKKSEWKKPFGRPRHRWEEMMVLKETGCEAVDGVHLAQGRVQWQALVNMVMNLQVP